MSGVVGAPRSGVTWAGLLGRWLRAAGLRPALFEEAAADPHALAQAAVVVLAAGLGRGVGVFPDEGWLGLVGGSAVGLVTWVVTAAFVWGVGVHWLGHPSTFPELLRALGYAAAPLVGLAACAALPASAAIGVSGLLHAWAFLALAVAVRAVLGTSPLRALWICAAALGSALLLLLAAATFVFDTVFID